MDKGKASLLLATALLPYLSGLAASAECSASCSSGQCHIRIEQRGDPEETPLNADGDGQFVLAGTQRRQFEQALTDFAEDTLAQHKSLQARMGDTAERFLTDLEQSLLREDWQHLIELRRQLRAGMSTTSADQLQMAIHRSTGQGAFCGCSMSGQPHCERI